MEQQHTGDAFLNEGYWFENKIDSRADETVFNHLSKRWPFRNWTEIFDKGHVEADGAIATFETKLRRGQTVRSFKEPWIEPTIDSTFEALAETEELVVVCKRKGYPVVPHGAFLKHSLLGIVRQVHPEAAPLHRLGRGTTGAIVFAKNRESARKHCKAFELRQVHKVYRCVVQGVPEWDELDAVCWIGPVDYEFVNGGIFAAVEENSSKQAKRSETLFTVVKRGDGWAVLDANIRTGRPHQIRIMTGFVGYPLVGDPLYGMGGLPKVDGSVYDEFGHDRPAAPGDTGYLLHSMILELANVQIRAPPPNMDEWAPYCTEF